MRTIALIALFISLPFLAHADLAELQIAGACLNATALHPELYTDADREKCRVWHEKQDAAQKADAESTTGTARTAVEAAKHKSIIRNLK